MGSGTVDVFATPMVAALMEGAACDLAARYIEDIYTTVGSGNLCTAFMSNSGRSYRNGRSRVDKSRRTFFEFKLTATDNAGGCATGTHTRVSVKRKLCQKHWTVNYNSYGRHYETTITI